MTPDLIKLLLEDGERATAHLSPALFANKRVLLSGASGLLGTHFLSGLICLQRKLGTGLHIHALIHRSIPPHIQALVQEGVVQFHQGELSSGNLSADLPRFDLIIHAATYGQPGLFMTEPDITLRLNTVGTFALFDVLAPNGKFLFLSSSEVYSGLASPPFGETQIGTSNTNHPRSCYIEGKRCGEAICQAYRQRGVDAKSARLSLAYGTGARLGDKRVLNSIIEKGFHTGSIRLLDRGLARRTYCYVADAAEMLWHILLQGKNSIYNVGGVSRTTIAELATHIGQSMGVPVIFPDSDQGALSGAPEDVRLDLSQYEQEFGPVDFLPLKEGLERTIAWYRQLVKAPLA